MTYMRRRSCHENQCDGHISAMASRISSARFSVGLVSPWIDLDPVASITRKPSHCARTRVLPAPSDPYTSSRSGISSP